MLKLIYFTMRFINAKIPHFRSFDYAKATSNKLQPEVGSQSEGKNQKPEAELSSDTRLDLDLDTQLSTFNLQLRSGRIVLLLGDSGSGKSTLMRCIAGFKDLEAGEIDLEGKDVAMLLQNPFHQIIMQKAHDELYFPQKNAGIDTETADKKLIGVCEQLGIDHLLERNINTLSFGEAQLLMIAATILTPADIYLFDEPTSHLDPPHIARFFESLSILAKKDKTILVSTQNTDEYKFADRVLFLDKGEIKKDLNKDDMLTFINKGEIRVDSKMIRSKLEEIRK